MLFLYTEVVIILICVAVAVCGCCLCVVAICIGCLVTSQRKKRSQATYVIMEETKAGVTTEEKTDQGGMTGTS